MSPLHLDVTKLIHLLTPQTKTTLHVDHIYYSLSFSIITYTNKEMNISLNPTVSLLDNRDGLCHVIKIQLC
jgi:hypothetical protein